MGKPILCLDFDGVIHSYSSGWQGAAIIPDPPVEGAMRFIYDALDHFTVAIFSSRSHQPGGLDAMRGWMQMHMMMAIDDMEDVSRVLTSIQWPTEKPAAMVTIDDRALTFEGVWPSIAELKEFKPWNKREPLGAAVRRLGLQGS